MLVLAIILLLFIILFFQFSKESFLDKASVTVDVDKNSVELPNNVSGIGAQDIHFQNGISIKGNNVLELGQGIPDKGASGTIQYQEDGTLRIVGAGKDGGQSKISLLDNVSIGSLLEIGSLQLANNKINYGDMMEFAGKGPVKMGNVESTSMTANTMSAKDISTERHTVGALTSDEITTKNMTTGGFAATGLLSANDMTATGLLTAKDMTSTGLLTANGLTINGPSEYKGDVNVSNNLTFGNNVGFKKVDNKLTFTSKNKTIGGFDENALYVNNMFKFGPKENNESKIEYSPNHLTVVGAGADKKIKLDKDVEIVGSLKVNGNDLSKKEASGLTIKSENKVYTLNDNGVDLLKVDLNKATASQLIDVNSWSEPVPIKNIAQQIIKEYGARDVNNNNVNTKNVNTNNVNTSNVNVSDTLTLKNKEHTWSIFVDDSGELRFSKQGVNRDRLSGSDREDGISIPSNGNIWLSQNIYRGWLNEKVDAKSSINKIGDWEVKQNTEKHLTFVPDGKESNSVFFTKDGYILKNKNKDLYNKVKSLNKRESKNYGSYYTDLIDSKGVAKFLTDKENTFYYEYGSDQRGFVNYYSNPF